MSDKLILVLEPKGTTRMAMTPEVKESIRSLKHNPGFQYLLNKLSLQREFMRKTLEEEAHVDIRKVDRLQNGIYWSNWLERAQIRLQGRSASHKEKTWLMISIQPEQGGL